MLIKALIFDFDGLIIDSESPEYQVWREVFAEHGRELHMDFWADIVGRPHTHVDLYAYYQEHVNPSVDLEQFRLQRRARVVALTQQQPVLPGVHDYLRGASELGMKIGLASSSSRHHVHGHLARLELLDYFHTTKCFEDTAAHKPDPTPYLAVLEEFCVAPPEAVAFEDSPNGVTSAKAAGIFTVAVPNPITERLRLDHADYRMESLAAERLDRLLQRVETARTQSR
ncbi:MAG: HAD family phosphatase [Deltaproteobacteria bacterium]|nr:HAD family phosphatase [Deltaproteobacteria bacterium]